MYKGKFDQKSKKTASPVKPSAPRPSMESFDDISIEELLGETPRKPAPTAQSVNTKKSAAPEKTAKTAARETPAKKQNAPAPESKKKRGPRLGGVIFYTLYFLFILLFFVATYFGLNWLHGWLADYEAAQPTTKSDLVFQQLFTDPDWGALYDAAGETGTIYEGKEAYVAYMENKVGDAQLNYMETSAGLSGNKKYVVRMGNEKVATFTLIDKNEVGEASLENLENITNIPDWQLGAVEVFYECKESYRIEKVSGHTVHVNGIALDDSFTIKMAATVAEEYLPAGTVGASVHTQQINGLMGLPTITVTDDKGNNMEVSYDEATRTFTERTEANTISDEEETVALEAAKAYCLWMIEEGSRKAIDKYYDSSSKVYNNIVRTTELWMQRNKGYVFTNESVTNYYRYSDDLFSVRVSVDLDVTRTDDTVKTYPFASSLFFRKNVNGNWQVFEMTNKDVTQPVGKVRLTFMNGTTQVHTDFYSTTIDEIVTPAIVSVPEGKVFSGWYRQDVDENGVTTLTLVFQPDDTCKVAIPENTKLEPMTLYALFEDANAVSAGTTEGA